MRDNRNKTIQYVNTGDVAIRSADITLNSGAIGSCVVVVAYDLKTEIGAMAHIMLPGNAPENYKFRLSKFAANALKEMINQLYNKGATKQSIKTCLLGGSNILKRNNDTIGNDNIKSVEEILKDLDIEVCAKSLGGIERRTALFDIKEACVYFTLGDSKKKLLWDFKNIISK